VLKGEKAVVAVMSSAVLMERGRMCIISLLALRLGFFFVGHGMSEGRGER
jgi:hypothetical protein